MGIGPQADSHLYGDEDSHTLKHVCEKARPHLPHLTRLGLGCIDHLEGVPAVAHPRAGYGKMQEASAGKDSTTGHWELAGIRTDKAFPTYPDGFPEDVIARFIAATGARGVLGNKAASGTAIIDELGAEHQRTGLPIVYTSADSVFQIAAHKDTIPLEELYRMCEVSREKVCVGSHAVGRVIARPFVGEPSAYSRISSERKDYALKPPAETVQEALQSAGIRTIAIGKIGELFDGVGFDEIRKTKSNEEGIRETLSAMSGAVEPTFIWVNLVDFDQEFGHRNDVAGFARSLEAFDHTVPDFLTALPSGGRLVITADHGNDPTTPSTDHSREFVPLLVCGGEPGRDLGLRSSFLDHAASVAAFFGAPFDIDGQPFEGMS
ncbi:MAG: phosphopentomutase [Rhodothermales bacterium]